MNSENYNALIASAFDKKLDTPEKVTNKVKSIEKSNNAALSKLPVSNPYRTPTSDELTAMRQYAIEYKKVLKRASKREVRNAVKEKFNIVIVPN